MEKMPIHNRYHIAETHPDPEELEQRTDSTEAPVDRPDVELPKTQVHKERSKSLEERRSGVNLLQLPNVETYDHSEEQVRAYIEAIDEDTLEEIFLTYSRRAGNEEDKQNWIPFSHVTVSPDASDKRGVYKSADNEIILFATNLHRPDRLLKTLIHEELHAVSYYAEETDKAIGYQTAAEGLVDRNFNEAVTEWMALSIMNAYLTQAGEPAEAVEASFFESAYFTYQQSLEVYTRLLSHIATVPVDTVRDALVRGYLRNGDVIPAELVDEIVELSPELESTLLTAVESGNPQKMLAFANELQTAGIITEEQNNDLKHIVTESDTAKKEYFSALPQSATLKQAA